MEARLEVMTRLIRSRRVENQQVLQQELGKAGFETTQASISRDLKRIGVVKREGAYCLSQIAKGDSRLIEWMDAQYSGDNLLVLRMGPGEASRVALMIDEARISGLLGTIAGDDTIFVAVKDKKAQAQVLRSILDIFSK